MAEQTFDKCNTPPVEYAKKLGLKYVNPRIVKATLPARQTVTSDIFLQYMLSLGMPVSFDVPDEVKYRLVTKEVKTTSGATLKQVVINGKVKRFHVVPELSLDARRGLITVRWRAEYNGAVYDFKPSIDQSLDSVYIGLFGFADGAATKMCCYTIKKFAKHESTNYETVMDLGDLRGARAVVAYIVYVDNVVKEIIQQVVGSNVEIDKFFENLMVLGVWIDSLRGRVGGGADVLGEVISKLELLSVTVNKVKNALGLEGDEYKDLGAFDRDKAEIALKIANFIDDLWSPIRNRALVAGKMWSFEAFGYGSITDGATVYVPKGGIKLIETILNDNTFLSELKSAYAKLYNVEATEAVINYLDTDVRTPMGNVTVRDLLVMADVPFSIYIDVLISYFSTLVDKITMHNVDTGFALKSLSEGLKSSVLVGKSAYFPMRFDILLEDGTIIVTYSMLPDGGGNIALITQAERMMDELGSLPLGVKRVTVTSPPVVLTESLTDVVVEGVEEKEGGDYEVILSKDVAKAVDEQVKSAFGVTAEELAARYGTTPLYGIILETALGYVLLPFTAKRVIVPRDFVEARIFNPNAGKVKVGVAIQLATKYDAIDPKLSVNVTREDTDVVAYASFSEPGYVKKYGFDVQAYGVVKKGDEFYVAIVSFEGGGFGAVTKEGPDNANTKAYVLIKEGNNAKHKTINISNITYTDAGYKFNVSEALRQTDADVEPVIFFVRTAPRFAFSSSRAMGSDVYINDAVLPRIYRVTRPFTSETGDALPAFITMKANSVTFFVVVKESDAKGIAIPVAALTKDIDLEGTLATIELNWEEGGSEYRLDWDASKKTLVLKVPNGKKGDISEIDVLVFDKTLNAPVNAYPSFAVYEFTEAVNIGRDVLVSAIRRGAKSYEDIVRKVESGEVTCPDCIIDTLSNKAPDLLQMMAQLGAFSSDSERQSFGSQKDVFINVLGRYYSLRFEVLPALFLALLMKMGLAGWGVAVGPGGKVEVDKELLLTNLENVTVNVFDVRAIVALAPVIMFFVDQVLGEVLKGVDTGLFGDVYDVAQNLVLVNKQNAMRFANAPTIVYVTQMDNWLSLKLKKAQSRKAKVAISYEIAGDVYTNVVTLGDDTVDAAINLDSGAYLSVLKAALPLVAGDVEAVLKGKSISDPEVRQRAIEKIWNAVKSGKTYDAGTIITNKLLLSMLMGYVPVPDAVEIESESYALLSPARDANGKVVPVENTVTAIVPVKDSSGNVVSSVAQDVLTFQRPEDVKNDVVTKVKAVIGDYLSGKLADPKLYGIAYFMGPYYDASTSSWGWGKLVLVVPFKALVKADTAIVAQVVETGDLANVVDGRRAVSVYPTTTTPLLEIAMLKLNEALLSSSPATRVELYYPVTPIIMPLPLTWVSIDRLAVSDPLGGFNVTLVGQGVSYINYYYLTSYGVAKERYLLSLTPATQLKRQTLPKGTVDMSANSFGALTVSLTLSDVGGAISELLNLEVEGQKVLAPGFAIYDFARRQIGEKVASSTTYTVSYTLTINDGPEEYAVPVLYFLMDRYALPRSLPINIKLDGAGEAIPVGITKMTITTPNGTQEASPQWAEVISVQNGNYVYSLFTASQDIYLSGTEPIPMVYLKTDIKRGTQVLSSILAVGVNWFRNVVPKIKLEQFQSFSQTNDALRLSISAELLKSALFSAIGDNMRIDFELIASNELCNITDRVAVFGTLNAQGVTVAYSEDIGGNGALVVSGLESSSMKKDETLFKDAPAIPNAYYARFHVRVKNPDGVWETYKSLSTDSIRLPLPQVSISDPVPTKIQVTVPDGKGGTKTVEFDGKKVNIQVTQFNVAKKLFVGAVTGFTVTTSGVVPSTISKCLTPKAPFATLEYVEQDTSIGLITVGVCATTLHAREVVGKDVSDLTTKALVLTGEDANVLLFLNTNVAVVEYAQSSLAKRLVESVIEAYHALRNNLSKLSDITAKFSATLTNISTKTINSPDDIADSDVKELAQAMGVTAKVAKDIVYLARKSGLTVLPFNEYYLGTYVSAVHEKDGIGVGIPGLFMDVVPSSSVFVTAYDTSFSAHQLDVVVADRNKVSIYGRIVGGDDCGLVAPKQGGVKTPFLPVAVTTATDVASRIVQLTGNDPTANLAVIGALLLGSIVSAVVSKHL